MHNLLKFILVQASHNSSFYKIVAFALFQMNTTEMAIATIHMKGEVE